MIFIRGRRKKAGIARNAVERNMDKKTKGEESMAVRQEAVRDVLTRRFGADADPDGLSALRLMQVLRAWNPRQLSLAELESRLEDALYACVRRRWGDELLISAPGGWRRLTTDDLAEGADALLSLLFADLPVHAANCELVRDYAMRTGSAAALGALCGRFGAFQSDEERALMRRILDDRSCD